MDCKTLQDAWQSYLHGEVSDEVRGAIELHLGDCQACQAMPVFDARLVKLLRDRLPSEKAPEALRRRIESSLRLQVASGTQAAEVSAPAQSRESEVGSSISRLQSILGSPWAPRLAMAAILVFLVLVPGRMLFRAPALAAAAVDSYERHLAAAAGEVLPCCHPLTLRPGDPLTEPSRGAHVPDLTADGLQFVMAGRCDDRGIEKTVLVYQSKENETFSLYITDRALENFQEMRSKQVDGVRQAHHRVHRSEVTIWESAGLVWFWIGPDSDPEYSTALADLRTL